MRQFRRVIAAIGEMFSLWQIAAILFGGPAMVIAALWLLTGLSWASVAIVTVVTVAPALVAVIGVGVIAVRRQSAARAKDAAVMRVAELPT